jgi:hypothetical protein
MLRPRDAGWRQKPSFIAQLGRVHGRKTIHVQQHELGDVERRLQGYSERKYKKYLRVLVEYADVVQPEITRRMIELPITGFFILHSNVAPACVTDTEVLVSRHYGTH